MECLGIRQKRSNNIPVPTDKMHTMQTYLNETYNTWGVTVPCGHGLKNYKAGATNDNGELDVTVIDDDRVTVQKRSLGEEELACEMCDGNQQVRKCMGRDMPKLVMIERSRREWEQNLTSGRNSKLTSIDKIEKQLIINDHRYLLVQINLGNGSHWVGITVIKGCYMLYDGLPQKKLEWVKADMKFDTISSCGGNYRVESMLYKDVGESVSEAEVKEGSVHGDDGKTTADVGEDNRKQPAADLNGVAEDRKPAAASMDMAVEDSSSVAVKEEAAVKPKQKQKKQQKKNKTKKTYHRMGLSISDVKAKGAKPTCPYCDVKMNRGLWHAVKKSKDAGEKHATTCHYHFHCCRYALSPDERRQMRTIAQSSSDLVDDEKEVILSDIGTGGIISHIGTGGDDNEE